jgi:hypothetical protein
MIAIRQTSNDCFDNPFRPAGASNWNCRNADSFNRIVVSPHEQGIADVNHLCKCNFKDAA